jgi:hypothetical protein
MVCSRRPTNGGGVVGLDKGGDFSPLGAHAAGGEGGISLEDGAARALPAQLGHEAGAHLEKAAIFGTLSWHTNSTRGTTNSGFRAASMSGGMMVSVMRKAASGAMVLNQTFLHCPSLVRAWLKQKRSNLAEE